MRALTQLNFELMPASFTLLRHVFAWLQAQPVTVSQGIEGPQRSFSQACLHMHLTFIAEPDRTTSAILPTTNTTGQETRSGPSGWACWHQTQAARAYKSCWRHCCECTKSPLAAT